MLQDLFNNFNPNTCEKIVYEKSKYDYDQYFFWDAATDSIQYKVYYNGRKQAYRLHDGEVWISCTDWQITNFLSRYNYKKIEWFKGRQNAEPGLNVVEDDKWS